MSKEGKPEGIGLAVTQKGWIYEGTFSNGSLLPFYRKTESSGDQFIYFSSPDGRKHKITLSQKDKNNIEVPRFHKGVRNKTAGHETQAFEAN